MKFTTNKENNLKNNFIKICLILKKNHKSQHNKQQVQRNKRKSQFCQSLYLDLLPLQELIFLLKILQILLKIPKNYLLLVQQFLER
jgi:hypothetical protein